MTDPSGAMENARLRFALNEQAAHGARLERELRVLKASRSWRISSPFRALAKALRTAGNRRPQLRPALVDGDSKPLAEVAALLGRTGLIPAGSARLLQQGGAATAFVDVTQLDLEDLGAGVQRVTRRLLAELLIAPPAGFSVEPVRLTADASYCHAREFLAGMLGLPADTLGFDTPISPRSGDTFIGLDFLREHTREAKRALDALRAASVSIIVLAHDVLPAEHPEWFPAPVPRQFEEWLHMLSSTADRVACISETTRDALCDALVARGLRDMRPASIVIPMGADTFAHVVEVLPRRPGITRFLMVGTIEPRKGHDQVLSAFELLWTAGAPVELVIAGNAGWDTVALLRRLRMHPQRGQRLHWLEGPGDPTLAGLYRTSDALLMASFGEGHGLPIAEAGFAGCGLLLRDLPVFREVAGNAAMYFDATTPEKLAEAILRWTRQPLRTPQSSHPGHWHTWAQGAAALAQACQGMRGSGDPAIGNQDHVPGR